MNGAVDFSCKHDILIRYQDGTLRPMDEPHFEVTEIAPHTWQIASSGDYHYLLEGDEEGIAIDTGYGAGNLRDFLESIINKPVRWVINTHHHFDHSAGNCYFEKAFMGEEGIDKACIPYPSFAGIEFPRDYESVAVGDGDIIPLKGRELEIFRIGDHTDNGIAILDRQQRIMFMGDELMGMGKMVGKTLTKFIGDMSKLEAVRGEFDVCYGGEGRYDAARIDIALEAAKRAFDGLEGEEAPERKGGPRMMDGPEMIDGHKVYDWRFPHFEDRPPMLGGPGGPKGPGPNGQGPAGGGKIYWKGYSVTYRTL